MSRDSTYFKTTIELYGKTYNSIWEVKETVEGLEEQIQDYYEKLLIMVAGNYSVIKEDEETPIIYTIHREVKDYVELIKEKSEELVLLRIYKEYLEEKEIDPEEQRDEYAFMDNLFGFKDIYTKLTNAFGSLWYGKEVMTIYDKYSDDGSIIKLQSSDREYKYNNKAIIGVKLVVVTSKELLILNKRDNIKN